MTLSLLSIRNFRNIVEMDVELSDGFNILVGNNGSGKTSFLESIYYLGSGKSFRTHINSRIIHYNADSLYLHANTQLGNQKTSLGLQRMANGARKIRINSTDDSIASLAKHLPIQVITTTSHRLFHDGPKPRRQLVDWGVFHVKPDFLPLWQNFQKSLNQRNAAIKAQRPLHEIRSWDEQFCHYGEVVHQLRLEYINQFKPLINNLLTELIPSIPSLEINYAKGWPRDKSLQEVIEGSLHHDRCLGFTRNGPHRADLQILFRSTPIKDHLSQGQQKLVAYGISCAQGQLMSQLTNKKPIYLIDDLPSELDLSRQEAVANILAGIDSQIFITAIHPESLTKKLFLEKATLFHMKQGQISTE